MNARPPGYLSSPFARFGRTHGLGAMSDAMLAVALAGSIFFSIDPDAAVGGLPSTWC